MKTKTVTTVKNIARVAVIPSIALFGMLVLTPAVNAATAIPYEEDFESSGTALPAGWGVTAVDDPGATSVTGVGFFNGSNMAFASKNGDQSVTVSQDFDYDSTFILSFKMQALADTLAPGQAGTGSTLKLESSSGVNISFWTVADAQVGSVYSIFNASDNDTDAGADLNSYSDLLSDWFLNSGEVDDSTVSYFRLEFFAEANTDPTNSLRRSSSTVIFDDVKVVPLPASIWLLGSGLLGLIGVARRNKA